MAGTRKARVPMAGPEGLCRICRSGAEICQRTALVRGSGTCHHRVYPGRGPERISGEEPGGEKMSRSGYEVFISYQRDGGGTSCTADLRLLYITRE